MPAPSSHAPSSRALRTPSMRTPSVVFVAVDSRWKDTNGTFYSFSYGVHALRASLMAAPGLSDVQTAIVDLETPDPDAFFEAVMAHRPTLVALSTYIWSLGVFRGLVERLRKHDPSIVIVAGGPAARRSVFDLAPHQPLRDALDAVIPGEGEEVIRDIVRGHQQPGWREGVRGLMWWNGRRWHTNKPAARPNISAYPSAYELGVAPRGKTGYIETFRGCPIHCAFCQWGEQDADRAHSVDYLVRHLEGLKSSDVFNVFFLDAAFNLHAGAFRNLVEAERQVGALKDKEVHGHLYPTHLRDHHLEFFDSLGRVHAAVGIQSFDEAALKRMGRPFSQRKFERTLEKMRGHLSVDIELIFGLPGDTPESFLRTLDKAIEFGHSVKVFQCLVLPDALLEQADSMNIQFDPETFAIESSEGWSARDLEVYWEKVLRRTEAFEERVQHNDWVGIRCGDAPSPARVPSTAPRPAPARGRGGQTIDGDGLQRLCAAVAGPDSAPRPTPSDWSLDSASRDEGGLFLDLTGPTGGIVLRVEPQRPESRFFHAQDGLAWSYRGQIDREQAPGLRRVIESLHEQAAELLPATAAV